MRIAMFTETFLPGTDGIVTRLCATLRHLEEDGHQVLLFAPQGAPDTYGAAQVVGVPAYRFFLYPEKRFALPRFRRIHQALVEFQPDFIHILNPAVLGLAGLYYAWRDKLPLVASYHTNVPAYARHYGLNFLEPALWWYFRTIHNHADINLCTSKATQQELAAHGFRHIGLWERGVDADLYRSARRSEEMRERLAPNSNRNKSSRVLLYVGRLAAEKGIQRIRPALDALPDVHFAIVGDGPYRQDLEEIFAGTNTVFTGYMHGSELAEAYASADGFVFPSTTETLGLVLFEAMSTGLPVMAADSLPTREVLRGGEAGLIFDPKAEDQITQTLKVLLYDDETRASIRQVAHEMVASLDWRGPTEQLLTHYRTLLRTAANA